MHRRTRLEVIDINVNFKFRACVDCVEIWFGFVGIIIKVFMMGG